jgi:hypothetical protein
MLRRLVPLLLISLFGLAAQAQGLRVNETGDSSLLKARVNLLSSDMATGSRLLSAQLLGDYYLAGLDSGMRLSGGLMLGPQSLLGSGMGLSSRGLLGVSHRRLLGRSDEASISQPYLGIGYSRHGSAWGFSADLGVAVSGNASGLRLDSGSAFAQSLDDTVRRLQWTPMLQLGVSYRF